MSGIRNSTGSLYIFLFWLSSARTDFCANTRVPWHTRNICHNNLTEKLEQSSGYPMLSDFKNSHPRTWPNSSHLVHFSSHKIYTTPQFSVYIDAKGRQSGACSQRRDKGPLMKSAAPRFSSFHGTWKVSRSNHCGIPEYTSFITEGVSPQKNLIYRFLLHWVPPITKLKFLKSWPHIVYNARQWQLLTPRASTSWRIPTITINGIQTTSQLVIIMWLIRWSHCCISHPL